MRPGQHPADFAPPPCGPPVVLAPAVGPARDSPIWRLPKLKNKPLAPYIGSCTVWIRSRIGEHDDGRATHTAGSCKEGPTHRGTTGAAAAELCLWQYRVRKQSDHERDGGSSG